MAHPEMDKLFDYLLKFAQQMLEKHGEFYPFGAVVRNGQVHPAAATDGSEQPQSQDVINLLISGFRSQARAGQIEACGICFDVVVTAPGTTNKTDAIQCQVEHVDGQTAHVFAPYTKQWLGRIKYGEIFATQGSREVFESSQQS